MRSLSRKTILVVLGLLALGIIAYQVSSFLHLASFSGSKLLFAVRNADAYYIILALVAIYSCYGIRSLRWQVFQRNIGDTNFWQIYKLTLAGFAAIFLLGRAGEPVRPLLLAKKAHLPVADTFGIYVLERIFDMASVAVIAAVGLILFGMRSRAGSSCRYNRANLFARPRHRSSGAPPARGNSERRMARFLRAHRAGFCARRANRSHLERFGSSHRLFRFALVGGRARLLLGVP